MDTVPGNKATEKINTQSTISRFACRLLCIRDDSDLSAMIFAAGFDSSRNIFQGKKNPAKPLKIPKNSANQQIFGPVKTRMQAKRASEFCLLLNYTSIFLILVIFE